MKTLNWNGMDIHHMWNMDKLHGANNNSIRIVKARTRNDTVSAVFHGQLFHYSSPV